MDTVKKIIKSSIHDNSTYFVFPSEISAVFWRKKSLKLTGIKAVLSRRFLSWDTFKEQHFSLNQSGVPVNRIIRNLFIIDLLEENREHSSVFRYIIPPEHASNSAAFKKMILSILPKLPSLIKKISGNDVSIPEDLKKDYRELYQRYTGFLEQRGLFEPGWMRPDISKLKDTYYLFFPEVIEDFREFSGDLKVIGGIKTVPLDLETSGTLQRFPTSTMEMKWVLNRIDRLLKKGASIDEIAITLPDMDTWRGKLEAAASLRSIPLAVREGKPILEFPGASFFRDLDSCISCRFCALSMKQLLLNGAVPWKEKDLPRRLVLFGVDNFCQVNFLKNGKVHDLWLERMKLSEETELTAYYTRLKNGIERVSGAVSFEALRVEIQRFTGEFIDTAEWEDTPLLKEFQFALDALREAADAYATCGNMKVPSPFKVWLSILEEKIYVPRTAERGISVFPYRVSGGIESKWHFIPGFSERVSSVVKEEFPFLREDQKLQFNSDVLDFSRAFIALYLKSGENVLFSMSGESFIGAEIPPAFFVSSDSVENYNETSDESTDIFDREYRLWRGETDTLESILPVMKAGYHNAYNSILKAKRPDYTRVPVANARLKKEIIQRIYRNGDNLKVSSTFLDTFYSCPYLFFLKYVLGVESREYVTGYLDNFTYGGIIHDCFKELFLFIEKKTGTFDPVKTDEYIRALEEIVNLVFQDYRRKGLSFFEPVWEESRRAVLKHLKNFISHEGVEHPGFSLEAAEKEFSLSIPEKKLLLRGRIDRISRSGDFRSLVDYKKSYTPSVSSLAPEDGIPASFQLYFYILLAEGEGEKVNSASYYNFGKEKYVKLFDESSGRKGMSREDKRIDARIEEMLNLVEAMKARIDTGDFSAGNCDSCDFRNICRTRFTVR